MIPDRCVVPFQQWHYECLSLPVRISEDVLLQMERMNAWSLVVDGQPIAIAGTAMQWPGRHLAWAYMTKETGPHMLYATQQAERHLAVIAGRIEATVQRDFEPGHRWMKMLGFRMETPLLERYGPDGADHVGYVRIN